MLFKGTSTTDTPYDPALYYTSFEPTVSASGFIIGGGLGAEYTIGSQINIFGEANLNIPANTVNGEAVEVEIPLSLQFGVGVRLHF